MPLGLTSISGSLPASLTASDCPQSGARIFTVLTGTTRSLTQL